MAAVTIFNDFGAQKIKFVTVSVVSPTLYHVVMGPDAMILVSECLALSQHFHYPHSHS